MTAPEEQYLFEPYLYFCPNISILYVGRLGV
jgi:hypothetical protein